MVFLLGAQWDLPGGGDRELTQWSLVQQFVGDSESLAGIMLLVAAVVAARGRQQLGRTTAREIDVTERHSEPIGS